MADNFHGVLIFVIFVVDLAVTKINAYSILYERCAKNIVEAWPTFFFQATIATIHPADGVDLHHNIVLSHVICPSFFAKMVW
jgi:hypothetical protein